jgi:hypothetical protein
MTLRSKALFSIALLFVAAPATAAEFTYREYARASEGWKRGFVSGISQYMATVAQPDEEAPYPVRSAYQRCFAAATEVRLVQQVEAYAARNPASSKQPMAAVVMRALFEFCRPQIEKAAPGRR